MILLYILLAEIAVLFILGLIVNPFATFGTILVLIIFILCMLPWEDFNLLDNETSQTIVTAIIFLFVMGLISFFTWPPLFFFFVVLEIYIVYDQLKNKQPERREEARKALEGDFELLIKGVPDLKPGTTDEVNETAVNMMYIMFTRFTTFRRYLKKSKPNTTYIDFYKLPDLNIRPYCDVECYEYLLEKYPKAMEEASNNMHIVFNKVDRFLTVNYPDNQGRRLRVRMYDKVEII